MAFQDAISDALRGFTQGFTGVQAPPTERDFMRREAAKAGLSVEDFIKLQQELARLAMEKDRAAMEQSMAATGKTLTDQQKSLFEIEKMARELEEGEAKKTAATGIRRGEDITQYTDPQGKVSAFQGTATDVQAGRNFAPGLYMEQPSQDEAYADVLRAEERQKLAREIEKDQFDRGQKLEASDRSERNLALDQRRESRAERYTNKAIEKIDEGLKIARGQGVRHLSTEQASRILSDLYPDMDPDDPRLLMDYGDMIRDLQDLYRGDPEARQRLHTKQVVKQMDQRYIEGGGSASGIGGRRFGFQDTDAGTGSMEELMEVMGGSLPPKPPPPELHLPARSGVPDERFLDPNIPLPALIGADPVVQKKIQEAEIKKDQREIEALVRAAGAHGIPEEEWDSFAGPEWGVKMRTYVDIMRNPGQVKGLTQQ